MGRPCKVMPNPNRHALQGCYSSTMLRYQLPRQMARDLDDILSGVTRLDFGGNTRPISQQLILSMLRDLNEISVQGVMDHTQLSRSYCKKLATVMRITVTAFDKVVAEDRLSEEDLSHYEDAYLQEPEYC